MMHTSSLRRVVRPQILRKGKDCVRRFSTVSSDEGRSIAASTAMGLLYLAVPIVGAVGAMKLHAPLKDKVQEIVPEKLHGVIDKAVEMFPSIKPKSPKPINEMPEEEKDHVDKFAENVEEIDDEFGSPNHEHFFGQADFDKQEEDRLKEEEIDREVAERFAEEPLNVVPLPGADFKILGEIPDLETSRIVEEVPVEVEQGISEEVESEVTNTEIIVEEEDDSVVIVEEEEQEQTEENNENNENDECDEEVKPEDDDDETLLVCPVSFDNIEEDEQDIQEQEEQQEDKESEVINENKNENDEEIVTETEELESEVIVMDDAETNEEKKSEVQEEEEVQEQQEEKKFLKKYFRQAFLKNILEKVLFGIENTEVIDEKEEKDYETRDLWSILLGESAKVKAVSIPKETKPQAPSPQQTEAEKIAFGSALALTMMSGVVETSDEDIKCSTEAIRQPQTKQSIELPSWNSECSEAVSVKDKATRRIEDAKSDIERTDNHMVMSLMEHGALEGSAVDGQSLMTMDPVQLRQRLLQVSAELQKRTKMESVRMFHTLQLQQKELSKKFESIIDEVGQDFDEIVVQKLTEQAQALQNTFEFEKAELEASLNAVREESILNTIQEERTNAAQVMQQLQNKFEQAMNDANAMRKSQLEQLHHDMLTEAEQNETELRKQFNTTQEENVANLMTMEKRVDKLKELLNRQKAAEEESERLKKLGFALISFTDAVNNMRPAGALSEEIRQLANGDEFITSVLDSIPHELKSGGNVSTMDTIIDRFVDVVEEGKVAMYTPDESFLGQLIGKVTPRIMFKEPYYTQMDAFEKAQYRLLQGDISRACKELEGLPGKAGKMASEWAEEARARASVDQATSLLSSYLKSMSVSA